MLATFFPHWQDCLTRVLWQHCSPCYCQSWAHIHGLSVRCAKGIVTLAVSSLAFPLDCIDEWQTAKMCHSGTAELLEVHFLFCSLPCSTIAWSENDCQNIIWAKTYLVLKLSPKKFPKDAFIIMTSHIEGKGVRYFRMANHKI